LGELLGGVLLRGGPQRPARRIGTQPGQLVPERELA
jgi:hypothetical protein